MNGERRGWHIGKEISLPVVTALFLQTIALVWWLAGLSYTVNQARIDVTKLEVKVTALEVSLNSQTEAYKVPAALNAAKITLLEANFLILEQRLRETQKDIDSIRAEQMRRAPFIPKKPQ